MFQIPTLYTNYQELLLDLDIVGKVLSESAVNKDELKQLLFEEYKVTHPLPTLEDKRYELSDLVSSDYHINYANEVELAENEQLVDLGLVNEQDDFELEGNIVVPNTIKEKCEYGNITDEIRSKIVEEYLSSTVEELSSKGKRGTEEVFNTTINNASVFNESDYEDEVPLDVETFDDFSIYSEDELGDDEDYSADSDNNEYDDGVDYSSNDEAEDNEDDSDDYNSYGDEGYEDDSSDDEDYGDDSSSDENHEDDSDDDSDTEDYGDDYDSDEDDSSDSEDEGYEDDSSNAEDYGDDYSSEDEGNYSSSSDDEDTSEPIEFEPKLEKPISIVPTPVEISNKNKVAYEKVVDRPETHVNREEEPRELREFVRKHPRCEVSFALQYFSRKEIEKYLMMGKIIKKGTKLHI